MVIGYTVYEPMNYTDENGVFTGFDTELATAVCQKLGVEPEFVEINWDTKIAELDGKSIDCIWNGMTLTDDILENTACTEPYVKNAQVVVMKADAAYSSTADLTGATIVAEGGSAGQSTVEENADLSQAELITKTVQTDCLMEVEAGTADAAVLDLTLASRHDRRRHRLRRPGHQGRAQRGGIRRRVPQGQRCARRGPTRRSPNCARTAACRIWPKSTA